MSQKNGKGWRLEKGVPIIFFFLLFSALAGYIWSGSARITKVESKIEQNTECIAKAQQEQIELQKSVNEIKERLSRIETHLEYMKHGFNKLLDNIGDLLDKNGK